MKHILSIFLLMTLLSNVVKAQSHKDILTKEANTYFRYMMNQNFDGVLDYMYPQVFEMAPRAQMKLGMQQMFNAPDMKIQFISNDVSRITDKIEHEGKGFVAVFYDSTMKMTFVTEEDQAEADKEGFLMFMKTTMETQFGEGNVTEELDSMSLIIKMSASMFAIEDSKYEGWKFLGNDDALKTIVSSVIPEQIRTELLNEKEKKNKE